VFEIDNTAGTAITPHTVPPYSPSVPSPSQDYSPGAFSAELIVTDAQGVPLECDKIPLAVVASCGQCPSVTVSTSTKRPSE